MVGDAGPGPVDAGHFVLSTVGRARRHTGSMVTRPPAGSVPDAPGSYQFVDRHGRVLYVGKAKSLRARLNSYFQDPAALPVRAAQMVEQADHVEWVVVDRESEALLLEHNLIQQHQPRYNVRLKDDKSYPWLAVTVSDEWPRPAVVRGRKRTGGALLRPLPQRGRHPHTRSTCCSDRFRCGRARTPSSGGTSASDGPACCTTSSGARARAWAWSTTPSTTRWSTTSSTSCPGTRAASSGSWSAEMRAASARPRVRAGVGAARPAGSGAGRRRRSPDGTGQGRGSRRGGGGRGRARGGRPGLPRALGQGDRPPEPCSWTRPRT